MSCCASLYACAVAISSSLRALRDLVLERALVVGDLGLRFGEPLRHVVERVRQQAQLVGRARRHVDVEPAGADRARRAHQPVHRRDEPPRQQQRGDDRERRAAPARRRSRRPSARGTGGAARPASAEAHVADRRRRRPRGCGTASARSPANAAVAGAAGVTDGDELDVALAADRRRRGRRRGRARAALAQVERRQLRPARARRRSGARRAPRRLRVEDARHTRRPDRRRRCPASARGTRLSDAYEAVLRELAP